jgi:serine/arginine repetitive matrix protein 2
MFEAPRSRLNSDSSSKRHTREVLETTISSGHGHARAPSNCSFLGHNSFAEIRRRFELGQDHPAFYPPGPATGRKYKRESVINVASVSSYGRAFDFAESKLHDNSQSGDYISISMSMKVDDTFGFMRWHSCDAGRQRVDSDASSFDFRALTQSHSHTMQHYNCAHRC